MDSKIIGTSLASLAMVVASGGAAWSMMTTSPEQLTAAADIVTYVSHAAPAPSSTPVAVAVAPTLSPLPVVATPPATPVLTPTPATKPPQPAAAAATPARPVDESSGTDRVAQTELDD